MKKVLLATALSMLFAAGALAEDNRDQAYGKHDMGWSPNSSMNRPNSAFSPFPHEFREGRKSVLEGFGLFKTTPFRHGTLPIRSKKRLSVMACSSPMNTAADAWFKQAGAEFSYEI